MIRKRKEHGAALLGLQGMIQMVDDREILVENCKQILEINDVRVRLRTGRIFVQIWGDALLVTDLNDGSVRVSGVIQNVELSR